MARPLENKQIRMGRPPALCAWKRRRMMSWTPIEREAIHHRGYQEDSAVKKSKAQGQFFRRWRLDIAHTARQRMRTEFCTVTMPRLLPSGISKPAGANYLAATDHVLQLYSRLLTASITLTPLFKVGVRQACHSWQQFMPAA